MSRAVAASWTSHLITSCALIAWPAAAQSCSLIADAHVAADSCVTASAELVLGNAAAAKKGMMRCKKRL
jgi:hypothetical protein